MKCANTFVRVVYKRASLECIAQLADTLCLPKAPLGRQGSPLINYKGEISKYTCPTVIIEITRKISQILKF